MDALHTTLLPLFAAIGVGFAVGRLKLFSSDEVRVLSRFVFQVAMPIAIFAFMQRATPPSPAYGGLIAGYLAGLAIVTAAGLLVARRIGGLNLNEAGVAVFTVVCGNAVFLGLPVALTVEGWATPFLVLMIFEGSLAYAIGHALITWPKNEDNGGDKAAQIWVSVRGALHRSFTNPIVLAVIFGLMVSVTPLTLPPALDSAASFFGRIASPMGLFILGVYLTSLKGPKGKAQWQLLSLLLLLKLAVFPLVTGGFTYALTGNSTLALVGAFLTGMPPAVSAMVMASTYRLWEGGTTAIVGVGTIVGLGTVTLFLLTVL